MPDRRNKNGERRGNWNDNINFVSHNWTTADDENYEAWLRQEAPTVEEGLQWLLLGSYRFSGTYDDQSACPRFSATGIDPKSPHNGWCFTSWAETVEDAILVTLYKIQVLYAGIVPSGAIQRDTKRR